MGSITLTVSGMGSDHCVGIIRSTLERLEGVESIVPRAAIDRRKRARSSCASSSGARRCPIGRARRTAIRCG